MNAAEFKLDVAAQNGKPKRLVSLVRLADHVSVRDEVNVNSARARKHFCTVVSQKLEIDVVELQWLDDKLVESADSADDEADKLLEDAPPREAKNQATQLVELCTGIVLFHDMDNEAFARFASNGHQEVAALRSKQFRTWLSRQYFLEHRKVPGSQALQDAIGTLEGQAIHDGELRAIFIRIGEQDGKVYLDLCNAQWQVVEISRDGWQVLDESPVMFRRAKAMLPLPLPVPGGRIDELREFVNMTDDDWVLFLAWLVTALRPTGPYPVLCVQGEHGSGKSSACEIARGLVDPNSAALRSEPREPRDLMVASKNSWVLGYDNISSIRPWQSDCLCRVATGGGFSTRTLYENDEETIFNAQRPIIVNGIEEIATRADLLDRCLLLNLPRIDKTRRRSKHELDRDFELAKPRILGALLTAVVSALRNLESVKLDNLPRMADFAKWATAAESGLGLSDGRFMNAYQASQDHASMTALESSPVGKVLVELAEDKESWQGTSTELLEELSSRVGEKISRQKSWPTNARALGGVVKRLSPTLSEFGVEVQFGYDGRGSQKQRIITVTRIGQEICVPTVPIVPTDDQTSTLGDAKNVGDAKIPTHSNGRAKKLRGLCTGHLDETTPST
jgi:hypothetical protein